MSGFRSGFVGIVGRPNVGKSTILNHFVGQEVAITSPRSQTTRRRILGVLTREEMQIVFVDTPGFHRPEHALGRSMVETAKAVLGEADVLIAVIDARAGLTAEDEAVFSRLRQANRPAILALNKVDLVKKPHLLPILAACGETGLFAACVPVSALTGVQMDVLLAAVVPFLPEGPRWYEPEQRTDQTMQQLAGEFVREQLLLATRQEVPHALAVRIDELTEEGALVRIRATILVEREGQKAIVIGRGGQTLKTIGQKARQQLERLVGRKVFLELWVKVAEDWRNDERMLRELGYEGR